MAQRFRRGRRGIGAKLDAQERELLRQLFDDVAAMLDDGATAVADPLEELVGISADAVVPDDPALARLLPQASRDDDEAASEFRRYTERGLRRRKRGALATASETLERPGPLLLADPEALAWMTALNDVRLVLAERIGVRTEEDAARLLDPDDLEPDDPRGWLVSVYDFLTWLQETLVAAVAGADLSEPEDPAAGPW
jgi:hypothetical protein